MNLAGDTFQKIELVYPMDKVGNIDKLTNRIERCLDKIR